MGLTIERERFDPADYQRFEQRLEECLVALVRQLLPAARQGLEDAGVLAEEAGQLLSVIEARAASGQTGAAWQRQALAVLEGKLGRQGALAAMLERYLRHQRAGDPVHTWPVPQAG